MSNLIFSNEIKTIKKILNSPKLSSAELLSLKYALITLSNIFPDKKDYLFQLASIVQSKINKNSNLSLAEKVLSLHY